MTTSAAPTPSKPALWTGRILATIIILWMGVLALVLMILKPEFGRKGFVELGFPEHLHLPVSILELSFVLLFAIPRTSILGGLFLTAYLGAASAAHLHQDDIPGSFLAILFATIIWLSLLLRYPRLRQLLPLQRN